MISPRWSELHPELRPGDVLVADRGFCSYAHLALLVQAGVHAVFRIHQKHIVDFTPGRPHGEPRQTEPQGPQRAAALRLAPTARGPRPTRPWRKPLTCPQWMEAEQFAHLPDRLEVRELRYRVHRKGFRVKSIPLVTTLLDAARYTVEALAQLY